jgi:hypothetical protein
MLLNNTTLNLEDNDDMMDDEKTCQQFLMIAIPLRAPGNVVQPGETYC